MFIVSVTLNLIKCSSLPQKQMLNSQANGVLKGPIKKKKTRREDKHFPSSSFAAIRLEFPSSFSLILSFLVSSSLPKHSIVQFRGFLPPFLASCLLTAQFLPMQVCLNLLLENKHPKLAVRSLVHGLGLHTHFVLLWG